MLTEIIETALSVAILISFNQLKSVEFIVVLWRFLLRDQRSPAFVTAASESPLNWLAKGCRFVPLPAALHGAQVFALRDRAAT